MRSEWVLEYKDYLAAQSLFNKGSIWRRTSVFFFLWGLPALAVLLVALLIAGVLIDPEKNTWRGVFSIWPLVFFASIFRFSYWRNLRRNYQRMFLNGDPTQPVYMDIDEERVISGAPGSSEGKFYWPTLLKFSEDDKIAIIYISKRQFLMIPKQKLKHEDWADMKSFITARVPEVR